MASKSNKTTEQESVKQEVKTNVKAKVKPFSLPSKKVLVRFVKRQTGYITNPKHVAYGGKLEGAIDTLEAKMRKDGKFYQVLTEVEQSFLEKKMFMNEGDMSIYKKDDNFWSTVKIRLGKEGTTLDLSTPEDYIKYKTLLAYDDLVSPSITETSFKKTYKYEIVSASDEDELLKKTINYSRKAYKLLDEIEESKEQLSGILRILTGRRVSTESNHDWLIAKVGEELERNPKRFVEILNDADYKIKLLIERAIDSNKVIKNRGLYKTIDGIELCGAGEVPSLDNAVDFLNDPKNQDIKLMLKG